MPIYEYRCPKCGDFDHMQKITEKPLKRCPTCGSGKLSKLISNPAFHLKGGGWYITDYARKGGDGGGKGSEGGASESKSESSSSSDGAKSESKSDKSEKKADKKKKGESASAAA